ncbi:citrate lyase acyl carrier protein [Spirochaeta isovalerica]|uniref:Citrate lyase acyl carrier protein n=1 Tax=Spirochaeta isovalerica TaxID=150 RepID=A0A841RAD8_9SPIO|nr:citrate lyase acyl carrier protein [Spirochaeta isovalerica]MBB6480207.1 citrate lyase subunit gamma (acyl carrier protein) [Spirochaeta isovalerica]
MRIVKRGIAGTLESSDVMITVSENTEGGIEIDLKSIVEKQFGKQIRRVISEKMDELDVKDALVEVNDKGALDCTIKARLESAAYRAAGIQHVRWEDK